MEFGIAAQRRCGLSGIDYEVYKHDSVMMYQRSSSKPPSQMIAVGLLESNENS